MRIMDIDAIVAECCYWGPNQLEASIGKDNGLAPNRRRAINEPLSEPITV